MPNLLPTPASMFGLFVFYDGISTWIGGGGGRLIEREWKGRKRTGFIRSLLFFCFLQAVLLQAKKKRARNVEMGF